MYKESFEHKIKNIDLRFTIFEQESTNGRIYYSHVVNLSALSDSQKIGITGIHVTDSNGDIVYYNNLEKFKKDLVDSFKKNKKLKSKLHD